MDCTDHAGLTVFILSGYGTKQASGQPMCSGQATCAKAVLALEKPGRDDKKAVEQPLWQVLQLLCMFVDSLPSFMKQCIAVRNQFCCSESISMLNTLET